MLVRFETCSSRFVEVVGGTHDQFRQGVTDRLYCCIDFGCIVFGFNHLGYRLVETHRSGTPVGGPVGGRRGRRGRRGRHDMRGTEHLSLNKIIIDYHRFY